MQLTADYSADELDRHYEQHLADVEAVQAEQLEHLRALIQQHGLKRVWIEGLTPDDLPVFRTLVSMLKDAKGGDGKHRELRLRVGAAGQLLASGELAEVLPLDEESTHRAAKPLREDGSVVLSAADNTIREKMMSQLLIAEHEPASVIVLGAAHDLADEFAGQKIKYTRIVPKRVEALLAQ